MWKEAVVTCLKELFRILSVGRETRKMSVRIPGAPAKILTGHLPNENWKDARAQISGPRRPERLNFMPWNLLHVTIVASRIFM